MKKHNTKKLTRTAVAAAVMTSASASAEVVLTENLSLTGFLGISAKNLDKDAYKTTPSSSDSSAKIDEFEVDFLFSQDKINAQVDLNYLGGPGDVELEQAHIGYAVSDSFSLKAGKFLSCIGFETFDMNGLYQYSAAASTAGIYPGHHTGLAGVYSGETFGVYGSVVDGTWSADGDPDNLGYEVQVFTSPAEGLTIKLGYATEGFEKKLIPAVMESYADADDGYIIKERVKVPGSINPGFDKAMINLWVSYEVDALTVAAEYSSLEDFGANGSDGDAYMLMGNYAFTDTFNATLRYAHVDADWAEIDEFTISPRFVISDSVSVITEYTNRDYAGGGDEDLLAARVLYTF
jgi:hypothetical protein